MKRINLIYIWAMLGAFVACSDEADMPVSGNEICLNAIVGDIESRALAETYTGATPTTDNPLKAWVWFSNTSDDYSDAPDATTHIPCHTVMEFKGGPTFARVGDSQLKYQVTEVDGKYVPVYCVGFHPAENVWSIENNKIATAAIDGTKDLMFAPAISATWGEPFGSKEANRNLDFQHLLTWVKVCVCATSQDASGAWGKITEMTISSKTEVSVDATDGKVTYSTDGTIPIDVATEGISLHTTMKEVGSVLCSPALTYTVNMNVGEKRINKEIKVTPFEGITLQEADDAKGKLFILTLYFNEFDVVDAVCTLNAWDAQNENLYMNPVTTP